MNTHKNQIDISLNGTRIQYRNIHGIEPTPGYRIIPCQGIWDGDCCSLWPSSREEGHKDVDIGVQIDKDC